MAMEILLNGKAFSPQGATTVLGVLQQMGLTEADPPQLKRGFAVCLNHQVIPRQQHATTTLHDHDKLEVIRPVGGG